MVAPLLRALDGIGLAPELLVTEAPGHARALTRELARNEASPAPPGPGVPPPLPDRTLLVVGGDGTIHEVVNGLRDAGFPDHLALAVLPVGTGNDFHRMLRARGGIEGVLDVLTRGATRTLDVGHVTWDGGEAAFVNLLGVGIDVEVLRRRARFQRLPGLLQYGAALLSALRSFRPVPLRIQGDPEAGDGGLCHESPALLAALTVGPSIGGGFLLSPEARADDGRLDLFLAYPLTPLQVLRYLPGVVRGTLGTTDRIHRATPRALSFVAADGVPFRFELDGEPMPDTTTRLDIRVLPRVLTLLDRGDHSAEAGGRA